MASVSFLQDMVPWGMFWKIRFQLTYMCDLNPNINGSFLLSYMFDLAIYIYKDIWYLFPFLR